MLYQPTRKDAFGALFGLVAALLLVLACRPEPRAALPKHRVEPEHKRTSLAPAAQPQPQSPDPVGPRGRIVRFDTGTPPTLVLGTATGELRVLGIDGRTLEWQPGDEVVVDGPEAAAQTIDCTEPARCSVGLRSGGDLVLRDIDAHSAVQLLFELHINILVAGPSRRATLEIRNASRSALAHALGAAFGLGVYIERDLIVLAPPAALDTPRRLRRTPKSRRVDLNLRRADVDRVTRMLADVSKLSVKGEVAGDVSIAARNLTARAVMDAYFATCGVQATARGAQLTLTQSANPCVHEPLLEWRCPQSATPPLRAVKENLWCIDPARLRVLALAFPAGQPAQAVLGEGAPRGDEIAAQAGDFIGRPQRRATEQGEIEAYWRIASIDRQHVELVLEAEGYPEPRHVEIKVPDALSGR
jgi:hypothetical protein